MYLSNHSAARFEGVTVLGLILILALWPLRSEACSCASQTMEQQFQRSKYVFSAQVIGLTLEDLPRTEVGQPDSDTYQMNNWTVRIDFDPLENYKGESSELPFIRSNTNVGICGFTPDVARRWIFFVDSNGRTGSCSGNIPWGGYDWMEDFDQRVDWLRGASGAD